MGTERGDRCEGRGSGGRPPHPRGGPAAVRPRPPREAVGGHGEEGEGERDGCPHSAGTSRKSPSLPLLPTAAAPRGASCPLPAASLLYRQHGCRSPGTQRAHPALSILRQPRRATTSPSSERVVTRSRSPADTQRGRGPGARPGRACGARRGSTHTGPLSRAVSATGGTRPGHGGVLGDLSPGQAHFLSSDLSQSGWAGRALGGHLGQPFPCPGERKRGLPGHMTREAETSAPSPPDF